MTQWRMQTTHMEMGMHVKGLQIYWNLENRKIILEKGKVLNAIKTGYILEL